MLLFEYINSETCQIYLVISENIMYKWYADFSTPIRFWLSDPNTFRFNLEYDGDITHIAVYQNGYRLFRERLIDLDV